MAEVLSLRELGAKRVAACAAAALNEGELVILPTDTVYGITAAVFRPAAVARVLGGETASVWPEPAAALYAAKKRDADQPSLILARSWADAARLCAAGISGVAAFCKDATSPVTVVVAGAAWLGGPPARNAKGGVAVRVPKAGFITRVLEDCVFLFSVSANDAGRKEPRRLGDVPGNILRDAALAVDGGVTPALVPSFIFDFTVSPPAVVRGGAAAARLLARYKP